MMGNRGTLIGLVASLSFVLILLVAMSVFLTYRSRDNSGIIGQERECGTADTQMNDPQESLFPGTNTENEPSNDSEETIEKEDVSEKYPETDQSSDSDKTTDTLTTEVDATYPQSTEAELPSIPSHGEGQISSSPTESEIESTEDISETSPTVDYSNDMGEF